MVIFGRRNYGRIHQWGDEWLQTSFVHLNFMPIVPIRSQWVRRMSDGSLTAIPARFSGVSVVMTYLRLWLPLLAIMLGVAIGGVIGALVGIALLAASIAAWLPRSLRSTLAKRKSDFNVLAFGTRCAPELMTVEHRLTHQALLETRHGKLADPRPPDDVARFGPKDLDEAVIAYGLLGLSDRAEARAAVGRLLAAMHDTAIVGEGPYRESTTPAAVAALHAQVASAAAAVSTRARSRTLPERVPWWRFAGNGGKFLWMLLAFGSLGALVENVDAFAPVRAATVAELADVDHAGHYVQLDCEQVVRLAKIVAANDANHTLHNTWGCVTGTKYVPVVVGPFEGQPIRTRSASSGHCATPRRACRSR